METDKKKNKARLYLQLDVLRLQYHPFKLHIKDS